MLKHPGRKGKLMEREEAAYWSSLGWAGSHRVPGSGAFAGLPGDVILHPPFFRRLRMECKAYKDGWKSGDKDLAGEEVLILPRSGDNLIYLARDTFRQIIEGVESGKLGLFALISNAKQSKARNAMAESYLDKGDDIFSIKANFKQPNYVMRASFFWKFMQAANGWKVGQS